MPKDKVFQYATSKRAGAPTRWIKAPTRAEADKYAKPKRWAYVSDITNFPPGAIKDVDVVIK